MQNRYKLWLLIGSFQQDWPVISKGFIRDWGGKCEPIPQYIYPTARLISELIEWAATPEGAKEQEGLSNDEVIEFAEQLKNALLDHNADNIAATVEEIKRRIKVDAYWCRY